MNQPPNVPPGYGAPQQPAGYGPPPSHPGFTPPPGPVPHSGSYAPPPQGHPQQAYAPPQSYPQQGYQQPHGIRGMTRQMFNPASYRQQGSGSYAAASFILALVGWFLCLGPLTWPISVLLGLIGLVGTKRAKGLSFAGVVISGVGIAMVAGFFALGMHVQFQGEKLAAEAGAPVVAAIEEFKNDNKRVPHSLDELVAGGYLPETWNNGTDELSTFVRDAVQGKKWSEFLRYKPGENATWKGGGFVEAVRSDDPDDWMDAFNIPNASTETKEYQTYGLAFIGTDGSWHTNDDEAVKQDGEKYDLQKLFGGGDNSTREITKKKRELQKMLQSLETKSAYYETALRKAEADLKEAEADLRKVASQRNLSTLQQIKGDKVANEHLQLIGETQKRLMIVEKKSKAAGDTHAQIKVKIKRLANQEEMAKLADSPEELAALDALIEESKKALDEKSGLGDLDKLSEQDAADEWFRNNFR